RSTGPRRTVRPPRPGAPRRRSLRIGSGTAPFQVTTPLLGVQTSLPRRTTGLGGSASARWWGRRLGQDLAHSFHCLDPVAGPRTILLHTHREHTVHQTPRQAFHGTLTPGPAQAPAGSHVARQRHPGRRRVDVLPTGTGGAGKAPPEIIGGDGHRTEVHIAPGFARTHCPHLLVGLHSLCPATRDQCAASCQFCPPPTDTASSTRKP